VGRPVNALENTLVPRPDCKGKERHLVLILLNQLANGTESNLGIIMGYPFEQ
jgi:hypothetical protein